jgi:hypothetical protein
MFGKLAQLLSSAFFKQNKKRMIIVPRTRHEFKSTKVLKLVVSILSHPCSGSQPSPLCIFYSLYISLLCLSRHRRFKYESAFRIPALNTENLFSIHINNIYNYHESV